MINYTKGEWERNGNQVKQFGSGMIAECPSPQNSGVMEFIANAQLIASAPDGLEAGIDAYVALLQTKGVFRIGIQRELCQLRDFIAKATGCSEEEVQNKYESLALAKAEGK